MVNQTVIVALPRVDDRVYKVSSEKVPHLTICFLGDTDKIKNLEEIVTFVQHAASQLSPFGLSVDYRDTLGPDDADVLFFKKDSWAFPRVSGFRGHLLQDNNIAAAVASAPQYDEWTPHLTLGYPGAPAHDDGIEHGIHYVDFDRIAIWTGDSEGPEFRLKDMESMMESSVAWSDMTPAEKGAAAVSEMFHYGVKGMKWGVTTKDRAAERTAAQKVTVVQPKPGKFAKTSGGKNLPLDAEAKAALEVRQKAKGSTTDALSNAELRTAIQRMQLEQQYSQLAFQSDRRSAGARFVQGLFGAGKYGKKVKFDDINESAGRQVNKAIKDHVKAKQDRFVDAHNN